MPPLPRLLSIGEPLVELVATGAQTLGRQIGGDTLNTAIYAARLLGTGQVGYHTALGTDPMSRWALEAIRAEGIDTATIARVDGAPVGLCAIHTDDTGERSFTYWRAQSAARGMLADGVALPDTPPEVLFTSAITLAILPDAGRARLLRLMRQARTAGRLVALDLNCRPALWPDMDTARGTVETALAEASLVLPSEEDIALLWPGSGTSDALGRILSLGAGQVCLTTGGGPVTVADGSGMTRHGLGEPCRALDTTGAGDAFNAGLLAARLNGRGWQDAIASAHRLAAHVTGFRGAVIPADRMPPG